MGVNHCEQALFLNVVVPDGAAEEAGLMVGDYLLAVNGTDVSSVPHSEAAELARQGVCPPAHSMDKTSQQNITLQYSL